MLTTIVALLAVFLVGDGGRGIRGSLSGGSYQPSEMAKLMIIVYLAVWMYAKRDYLSDVNFGLIPLAAILGVVGGLIMSQPDISAASTVIILGGIMFFLAGGDWRQISALLIIAIIIGFMIVNLNATGSQRVDDCPAGPLRLESLRPLAPAPSVAAALQCLCLPHVPDL